MPEGPEIRRAADQVAQAVVDRALREVTFAFGRLEDVLPTDDVAHDPRIARLGPDALHESTTPKLVAARLRSRAFAGRQLGALLLDQGFVAGLGNYLRSDILHRGKVRRRPRDMPPATLRALARAIVELPRRSYETAGITNDPRRVASMRKAGFSRRELRHLAFRRAGQPCYGGGEIIERIELSRAVFVCPRCQPEAP